MLREIGFDIIRVGGAVRRDEIGERAVGNHMVGLVDLDRRYVVDVGLGGGPRNPFVLQEGEWSEGSFRYRLERLDDVWWRFHNHQYALATTFDFTEEPRRLDWYEPMCTFLQTDQNSPFMNHLMVFRRHGESIWSLIGTTYYETTESGRTERTIGNRDDFGNVLVSLIDRELGDDVDILWERAKGTRPFERDSGEPNQGT